MHRAQSFFLSSVHRAICRGTRFRTGFAVLAVSAMGLATAQPGAAQPAGEIRYAEEPTGGVDLPATALAGEYDSFSVVKNPAGMVFLSGYSAGLGLNLADDDDATASGRGLGFYLAYGKASGILPRIGLGLGVEFLQPSRITLDPDPGSPTRLTLAGAVPLGSSIGVGVNWHRFFDDPGRATDALSTWDFALSARLGSRLALGGAIRDVNAPTVAGTPVQRRYELEAVLRPLATDRLELGVGGRIGETRTDIDGWARLSLRMFRGVYLRGEIATRELDVLESTGMDTISRSERELLATAGVEISLGGFGLTFLGTAARSDSGDRRLASGALHVRVSSEHIPSLLGQRTRIERIELKGTLGQRALTGAILRLRTIARDPAVVAVVLQIDGVVAGWASVQELRREVLGLRQAGKKVFAYVVAASTRDYFLASASNKVYLDPAGGIRLTGFASTSMYFKGMFNTLGVAAQFEKIDEYKSAPEQWTNDSPTEPARRMRNELYNSLYGDLLDAIASERGIDRSVARTLIDGGPYTAGDLGRVEDKDKDEDKDNDKDKDNDRAGDGQGTDDGGDQSARPRRFGDSLIATSPLIDAIAEPEQVSELIIQELGAAYPVASAPRERAERWSYPRIALIYIDGDIVAGKSRVIPVLGRKLVGGETIAKAIVRARLDPRIKAIVLRIDSPGGSALASEIMAREVFKTRGVKPIICSLGDVAASGGYFAAAGCDTILAEPMTITGSIGIFYGKFDISGLLSNLGISWHTYKRGANSDLESFYRPFTDQERTLVKNRIRYFYGRFIDAVARGRGLTREQVDAIGRGRVWSGTQAKERKLVDRLGSLSDALSLAKARIGLGDDDRVRIVALPEVRAGLLDRLIGIPGLRGAAGLADRDADTGWFSGATGLTDIARAIPASLWAEPDAVQARLPFHIVWH
ncbi:MAG: signal peptide peptidase SppA [Proteobacteria bacterium]|nr:signal peptide peptidase SppA [Pseudomonadota bacterium]